MRILVSVWSDQSNVHVLKQSNCVHVQFYIITSLVHYFKHRCVFSFPFIQCSIYCRIFNSGLNLLKWLDVCFPWWKKNNFCKGIFRKDGSILDFLSWTFLILCLPYLVLVLSKACVCPCISHICICRLFFVSYSFLILPKECVHVY